MTPRRPHARIALARPGNVLTSVADAAAGWALVGGDSLPALALIAGASASLYAGGITLNDVCDAPQDATNRPERPIPAGLITRRAAAAQAAVLLALGVALAAAAVIASDPAPAAVAATLAITIILYNIYLKRSAAPAALSMGACRGLNILLGVSIAGASAVLAWWPAALGHVAHIAGVTFLARHEAGADRPRARRVTAAIAFAATAATAVAWLAAALVHPGLNPVTSAPFLLTFVLLTCSRTLAALRSPTESAVRAAVTSGVLGVVLLDAAIAAAAAGFAYGLLIAALAPAAWLLSRRFAVT